MSYRRVWPQIVWMIARALASLTCRMETQGRENVPKEGPFIVASNHLHLFDPALVFVGMPYHEIIVLAAEKWAERWPFNWLLKSMNAIFVRRGEVDREALNQCLAVLKQGGVLGLAPEGTRSRTGTMQRGKPGIAYLAIKADVPILPVGVSGQTKIFAEWKRLRRPHITVNIGQPFKLQPLRGQHKSKQLVARSDEVMGRIAALVNEELRGVYTEAARELGSTALLTGSLNKRELDG